MEREIRRANVVRGNSSEWDSSKMKGKGGREKTTKLGSK